MIQLRLRLYLLVFLLVWSAPLAHRAAQLAGYDPAWLRLLHTVTQCSMGWLNCLVYGCNEATLKPYRERFASLSCSLFGLQLHRLRRSTRHSFSAAAVLGGSSGSTSGGAGIGPNEWRVDRSRLVCADSLGGSQHMGGSLDACSGIDTQQQSASASANATSGTGAAPVGAASGV